MGKEIDNDTKNHLRDDIDNLIADLKDNTIYSSTVRTAYDLLSNLQYYYNNKI